MKKYRTWVIAAIALQLITGCIHGITLFLPVQTNIESEKLLVELFNTQQMDFGSGFHRTLHDVFLSVSVCLTLLYLFGGTLNWYLLRKKIPVDILSGVITMQVIFFGAAFIMAVKFAFLPPITFMGLSFLMLLLARICMPKPDHALVR